MLWSALRHIFAGLKRTRDQKLSSELKSGHLNLSSLFHHRGTYPVECVAAHLRRCWRSLFYCGVYLLPRVLHDSSEFRFPYSLMACFAIRDTVEEYALLNASLHMFVAVNRTWELKLSSVSDEWSTALGNATVYVGVTIFALSFLSEC